jgi:glycosyltransferase involved in cell wall biosynthesis
MEEVIVSISCISYNQAPYIRQCLDGFLMQKTNFAFEVLVHDDCSTDGTDKIIAEYALKYPEIIKPIYEVENQYQNGKPMGSAVWNFPRSRGKYLAICEGDDYWTDSNKLQMEVDYLESHPECGMVYTESQVLMNDTGDIYTNQSCQQNFVDILTNEDRIVTLTTCFRKQLFNDYVNNIDVDSNWKMGDLPMWLYFSYKSKLKLLPCVTGVYRFLSESASHSKLISKKISFSLNSFHIREYFAKKYNAEKYLKAIALFELNDLCKISICYDKNISLTILKFAFKHSLINFRIFVKILLYSTKLGRLYHQRKYGGKTVL